MGDNDKSADALARILAYGDAAVLAGQVATQSKVVPPPKPPPPPPVDVIRLILIDRRSLVTDSARKTVKTRLERDLNALGAVGRFEVLWESKMPNAGQQDSYGKWDFPIYFEKAHSSDNFTTTQVLEVLQHHGIRNAGGGKEQYKQAEDGWNSKTVEGLGIQPLQGYRKVGFLKVDQLSGRTRDVETAYTNVVKHEFGHMCNIKGHAKSGLMIPAAPVADDKAQFAADDKTTILEQLKRLKNLDEPTMQRAYETANR